MSPSLILKLLYKNRYIIHKYLICNDIYSLNSGQEMSMETYKKILYNTFRILYGNILEHNSNSEDDIFEYLNTIFDKQFINELTEENVIDKIEEKSTEYLYNAIIGYNTNDKISYFKYVPGGIIDFMHPTNGFVNHTNGRFDYVDHYKYDNPGYVQDMAKNVSVYNLNNGNTFNGLTLETATIDNVEYDVQSVYAASLSPIWKNSMLLAKYFGYKITFPDYDKYNELEDLFNMLLTSKIPQLNGNGNEIKQLLLIKNLIKIHPLFEKTEFSFNRIFNRVNIPPPNMDEYLNNTYKDFNNMYFNPHYTPPRIGQTFGGITPNKNNKSVIPKIINIISIILIIVIIIILIIIIIRMVNKHKTSNKEPYKLLKFTNK